MISLSGIEVVFGAGTPLENRAIRGIDLDIPEGTFVSVIGSNGAGKSTLLNTLSGEVRPSAGRVRIDELDVTGWPAARRAGLVARVFQDPMAGSCADLTIEENLALAASRGERRGFGLALGRQRRETFRAQLSRLGLGLEDRLSDRMGLLSGGQRQAVSLLMATLQPAKILLLDEHTAALDPRMSDFVLRLTHELVEQQALTTLMVTHSMRQALDFGTRTVMLHEGRIALDVAGDERHRLGVDDLVARFAQVRGEELDSDALLLG
ncbi:ABC transporter ATP-binding protein [Ferruginivarius sediminum]|uniref:ATP-binding cassette domain-containing protein n=1 Tax=Ferruginivarius sediminum TaxID=2661937 RepID=A0A369TD69_9PROT|nr:ABC transporter ATP-binding protein [Ferruginivarius sediminum]RDD62772.1 ATP-binding cassette domain-containing protein [Ferruginivarius sediminum]